MNVLKETKQETAEAFEANEETAENNLEATMDEIKDSKNSQENPEDDKGAEYIERKLQEKSAQYEETLEKFQRLQADFANYKKRVDKEKSEVYTYANEKIAKDLLEIIDNLERALESTNDVDENNPLLQGVNLVYKQLMDTLNKHEVEEIEALGKSFDMNLHYAVMQEEADGEPNKVIEVLQKGYKIKDKILRPAMVKVSK